MTQPGQWQCKQW